MRKTILTIIAVFVTWAALDFILHGLLLVSTYEATAHLWRSMEEMKAMLMYGVTFVAATVFVSIYKLLCSDSSLGTGLKFGALVGLFYGTLMGWGSYCYMPIPLSLALSWFIGIFIEMSLGGLIIGKVFAKKS